MSDLHLSYKSLVAWQTSSFSLLPVHVLSSQMWASHDRCHQLHIRAYRMHSYWFHSESMDHVLPSTNLENTGEHWRMLMSMWELAMLKKEWQIHIDLVRSSASRITVHHSACLLYCHRHAKEQCFHSQCIYYMLQIIAATPLPRWSTTTRQCW
jgi:hypothetical protein